MAAPAYDDDEEFREPGDELPARRGEGPDAVPATVRDGTRWDDALRRAADRDEAATGAPPPLRRGPSRSVQWALWGRLLVPLAAFAIYGVVKFTDLGERLPTLTEIEQVGSLTGVRAEAPAEAPLDDTAIKFVGQLEGAFQARRWDLIDRLTAEPPPGVDPDHPVVGAFGLIAAIEQNRLSLDQLAELEALEAAFEGDKDRRALLDYLRLMRAEVLLHHSSSPGTLARRSGDFRQILASQRAVTDRSLELRTELASAYERAGDELAEAAGRWRIDKTVLSDARSHYQHALRWLTTPDGWLRLDPVSPGLASSLLNRIKLKLREANKNYHGLSLPYSGKDSETWTGLVGEPINDAPGGRW
ncbi:MAG: hypothetical protein RLY93_20235 [Sumerlaeia bacterium]